MSCKDSSWQLVSVISSQTSIVKIHSLFFWMFLEGRNDSPKYFDFQSVDMILEPGGASCYSSLNIDALKVCRWSFEFFQLVLGIKGFFLGGMRSSFYMDQWRDSRHLLLVYSWKYQSIESIIMISNYTSTRIYRCANKIELKPIYVTLTTRR